MMGIDVESQQTIDEAIAKAQLAGQALIDSAVAQIGIQVRAWIDETFRNLDNTVITIGPIQIPAFTIKIGPS